MNKTSSKPTKQVKSEKPLPAYYCRARALKNWQCNFNGTPYKFKVGAIVEIKEREHFEKLSNPFIMAVEMEEG